MKGGTGPSFAREVVKALEDELLPAESSTDLLPWAWLIRLDLEFRDRAWVRLTTLLAALVLVPLAIVFLATVFPSVFR